MHINTERLENFVVFKQRRDAVNSQSISLRVSNTSSTEESKQSKDDISCVMSISSKSKKLFKQLSEQEKDEVMRKYENMTLEEKMNAKTLKVQSFNAYANENVELQCRLMDGFFQCYTERFITEYGSFDALEDAYKNLGEELKSKYSGAELDDKLNMLDEEYGNALDDIFDRVKNAVNFGIETEGKEGAVKSIEYMFGHKFFDLDSIIADIDPERFEPFSGAINELVDYLAQMKEELKELYIQEEWEKESLEIDEAATTQPTDAIAEYLAKMKRESANETETLIESLTQETEKPAGNKSLEEDNEQSSK